MTHSSLYAKYYMCLLIYKTTVDLLTDFLRYFFVTKIIFSLNALILINAFIDIQYKLMSIKTAKKHYLMFYNIK